MSELTSQLKTDFPDSASRMVDLEEEIKRWAELFEKCQAMAQDAHEEAAKLGSKTSRWLIAHALCGATARIHNLLDGVVLTMNGKNIHAAPSVARAAFECSCMPIYLNSELVATPRLRTGDENAVHKILWKASLGSHSSSGIGYVNPISVTQLVSAANSVINELGASVGEDQPAEGDRDLEETVRHQYSDLSELTHPRWLAMSLSSTIDKAAQQIVWDLHPAPSDLVVSTIIKPTAVISKVSREAAESLMNEANDHVIVLTSEVPELDPKDVHGEPPE